MSDDAILSGEIKRGNCEECSRLGRPLRSIKMRDGSREFLCQSCFREAVEESRVAPDDPRIKTMVGGNYE